MDWDLSDIYPPEVASERWEEDFARAMQDGSGAAAKDRKDLLWSYAYSRHVSDVREVVWEERCARVENLEVQQAPAEGGGDEAGSPLIEVVQSDLQAARIEGRTLFQAATSPQRELRERAFAAYSKRIEADADRLASDLGELVARSPWKLREDYQTARHMLLQMLPTLQAAIAARARRAGRPLAWFDLSSGQASPLDRWDARAALGRARSLYDGLLPVWGRSVDALIQGRRLAISSSPYKAQGAFSMPLPGGRLPLCYVHEVRGRESVYGLVHELGHGVHFAAYRGSGASGSLPAPAVLELFPMAMELVACRAWEGEEAHGQKAVAMTLLQFAYVEMRLRLQKERPHGLAVMQELWDDICFEVFGPGLAVESRSNRLWLANRYVWSSDDAPQSYVTGAWAALETASRLASGDAAACAALHELMKLGAYDWLGAWLG